MNMLLDNLDEGKRPLNDKKVTERKFDAIRVYDQTLLENPHDARIWNKLGWEVTKISEFKFALHAYDRAVEINPKNPRYWQMRGDALRHLGRTKEADVCFTQAETLRSKRRR